MDYRGRRFGLLRSGLLPIALVLAAILAPSATAFTGTIVMTDPPNVYGNQATFHGTIATTCPSGAKGYFVIHDVDRNKSYDTLVNLGHPDQQVGFPGGSYSEGPFALAPNTNFTVTAHAFATSGGCNDNATGAPIAFRTGEAIEGEGLADPNVPADLSVIQQMSADPTVGRLAAITINASNGGSETATDAYVKDFMPAGFEYVDCTSTIGGVPGGFCWWDGTNMVVDDFGDLASGVSATVTIFVRPTVAGNFVNSVGIGSDTYDPDSTNEFVDLPVTVG
jgi:uncharacterized repeat protein (TIGR01451 family)